MTVKTVKWWEGGINNMKQKLQQNKRGIAWLFGLTSLSLLGAHFNHAFVVGLQMQVLLWLVMLMTKYLVKKNFTMRVGSLGYVLSLERGLAIIIVVDIMFIVSGFFSFLIIIGGGKI
jgi:hypothetical protein